MSYIFIDESGDLGTKKLSSRYFVMAAIKVDDPKKLDRIISKTKKSLRKKIITNEIKGSKLPKEIKFALFNRLRYKVPMGYDNKKLYDIFICRIS